MSNTATAIMFSDRDVSTALSTAVKRTSKGSPTIYFHTALGNSDAWTVQVGTPTDEPGLPTIVFDPNENKFDEVQGSRLPVLFNLPQPAMVEFFDAFDLHVTSKLVTLPEFNRKNLSREAWCDKHWRASALQGESDDGTVYPFRLKTKMETATNGMYPRCDLTEFDSEKNEVWDIHFKELAKRDRGIIVLWPYNVWHFKATAKYGVSWVLSSFRRWHGNQAGFAAVNMGGLPAPVRRAPPRAAIMGPTAAEEAEAEADAQRQLVAAGGDEDSAATVTVDPLTMAVTYAGQKRGADAPAATRSSKRHAASADGE